MPKSAFPFPKLRTGDLKDPKRLNDILQFMAEQIATVTPVGNSVSLPNVKLTNADQIPTDPNTVLTRGQADKLYGPRVQRTALVEGTWTPTGQSVQPLPFQATTAPPASGSLATPSGPVSPPPVPPGPPPTGSLCTTPTIMSNSVCYSASVLGPRNVQSFFWFQQQIAVGAGNPWDFGCFSGSVFFWPQISQMLIINGIPSVPPAWLNPGNWPGPVGNPLDPSIGFIAAGFPPYDPIGVYYIHKLSICGGFDA